MKILHTTIYVTDLEKSLEFYKKLLGAEPVRRFKAGPNDIAFLGDGEAKLELIQGPEAPAAYANVSMGIACDDILTKKKELDAAGYETTEMMIPQPGVCFFFVSDPDGFKIQFINE